ncbi:MAG: HNH endonuclease [Chloroflexi bacterium]|nr:HNH endonuclease [Chloroflexota bacterium]
MQMQVAVLPLARLTKRRETWLIDRKSTHSRAETPNPETDGREVLVEAGHRCAIPTCRQTPVEIAHIVPWEQIREHGFDNLIALCPTCHARYDRGEIDRKAMLQYKANLSVLNGRYGDLEQRVLRLFAEQANAHQIWLPGGFDILLMNLLKDGFLTDTGQNSGVILAGVPSAKLYGLTGGGREFIKRWLSAQELE